MRQELKQVNERMATMQQEKVDPPPQRDESPQMHFETSTRGNIFSMNDQTSMRPPAPYTHCGGKTLSTGISKRSHQIQKDRGCQNEFGLGKRPRDFHEESSEEE
jgi:hypothetical protein